MTDLIRIKEFKQSAKVRFILHLVLIIVLLTSAIAGSICSLIFSTLDYNVNLILNIVCGVLILCFGIFYFLNIFPIVRHYYSFYKGLNEVNLEHRRRLIYLQEINEKEIDNTKYRVLLFKYNEGEKEYKENLYVLDNNVTFKENQEYKIVTYHNVIIRFEEI